MQQHPTGEIARFRQQQELEYEAAKRALYSPAIVVSHDIIEKNLTRGADYILQFIEQGNMQEAIALMNDPNWGKGGKYEHDTPTQQDSDSPDG
jgi:hypothetical protein